MIGWTGSIWTNNIIATNSGISSKWSITPIDSKDLEQKKFDLLPDLSHSIYIKASTKNHNFENAVATPEKAQKNNPASLSKNQRIGKEITAIDGLQQNQSSNESTSIANQDLQDALQRAGQYKALVVQRMAMASNAGLIQKNPAAQVRILLSAFGDCEGFINSLLSDFSGVTIPPEAKAMIASFRALQATIMAEIRNATGLSLNNDEMRALLEKDASQTKQNISINSLIRQDKTMTPDSSNQADDKSSSAVDDTSIKGIHSNPEKLQQALASSSQKTGQDLDKVVQQASAQLQAFEQNPNGNSSGLQSMIATINKGLLMCGVFQGLSQLQYVGNSSFSAAQQRFNQLLQRLTSILDKKGISKEILVNPADVTPITSTVG